MEKVKGLLSYGNTKIGRDTAIFNMSSASNCPSDNLKMCRLSNVCYAKKAERQYKQVVPYRDRQEAYWRRVSAERFAAEFKETIKHKRTKLNYFRFNEAGDFHTQECVDKFEEIARLLKEEGIQAYTYTARRDLDFSNVKNGVINGTYFMVHNEFKPVKNISGDKPICIGDCSRCHLCKAARGLVIEVKIH